MPHSQTFMFERASPIRSARKIKPSQDGFIFMYADVKDEELVKVALATKGSTM